MIKILIKMLKCMKKKKEIVKVNTDMRKNNSKKKQTQVIDYDNSNISEERMIEIQAEAYYRALKRIERDKEKEKEKEINENENNLPKKKKKWYIVLLNLLNIIFFPFILNKNIKDKNKGFYDATLVIFISLILHYIGIFVWLLGVGIIIVIVNAFSYSIFINILFIILGFFIILLGSTFYVAGSEFEKETDSNKIYAYSASILALISCVVGVIALLKGSM